jgi:uncharacterized protein YwgA
MQKPSELTNEEWILAILHANNQKPIFGKLMLVKQVFLVAKEIEPSLERRLNFFPYDLGPYSKVLAEAVDTLVKNGLIEVQGSGGDYIFTLTTKGKEIAESASQRMSQENRELLERKRRAWDQLGYRGIVRLVYTRYPEYTGKSRIIKLTE